jgi:hypothetical protein
MGELMLVRLVCGLALVVILLPGDARADCAQEISRLMSRDTEKLTSRYNRVSRRIERQGPSPRLQAESCRIAKQLEPMLRQQIAALKRSGCSKNPEVSAMVADIVRAHEDDLAMMRKGGSADCK